MAEHEKPMSESARSDDVISSLETRVRKVWAGDAGLGIRIASALYGLGHDGRNLLFDAGILESRGMPIPVISVGGLTSGGSGKTPISAAVAGWLVEGGRRPAVITGGVPDEAAVHRMLSPDLTVIDRRDRRSAVRSAMESGAGVAVLDSGFQHRRVRSDLQIVCVDAHSALLPGRRRLPAGPFRDRWSALQRAHAVVLVRRGADSSSQRSSTAVRALLAEIQNLAPGLLACSCVIRPTGLRAANAAAEGINPSRDTVAVAGVMWPESFFVALDELGIATESRLAFRDHEPYASRQLESILTAGTGGVVCTLKDAVKLGPLLADEVPVWYLEEEAIWEVGEAQMRRGVLRTAVVHHITGPADSLQGDRL